MTAADTRTRRRFATGVALLLVLARPYSQWASAWNAAAGTPPTPRAPSPPNTANTPPRPPAEQTEQAEHGEPGRTEQAELGVTPAPAPARRAESPLNQVLESPPALGGFVIVSVALATAVWRRPIRPVPALVAVFALVAAVFDIGELRHQLATAHPGLAALAGLIAATRVAVLAGTGPLSRASWTPG